MSGAPEISVIVPVRNGARSLPELLGSLGAQTLGRDRFETIVVDNNSSDGTAEVAEAHGARVAEEPVPNRSRARNRGVAVARSSLYAFTDVDCVAETSWLEALLSCRESAPLAAGEVKLTVGNSPNAIERFEQLWRFGQEAWVAQGWAATANLLVHEKAFTAVGGFDPAYRHIGEDADFCLRAGKAGFALTFCPRAVVHHRGERSLRPLLERFFRHGYGSNQVFRRCGAGYRAWRDPLPALHGDRALRQFGYVPEDFSEDEWRRMARLARAGYAARVAGSLWAELRHPR